jgi:hypothetical protein
MFQLQLQVSLFLYRFAIHDSSEPGKLLLSRDARLSRELDSAAPDALSKCGEIPY